MQDVIFQDEVFDGVKLYEVRSPTLPPASHTNSWFIEGHTIVDPAATIQSIKNEFSKYLRNQPPIEIFLTHHHHDHIGSVSHLVNEYGCATRGHRATNDLLPFNIDNLHDTSDIEIHPILTNWEIHYTPGHAPGHLCLIREDGVAVVGDMVAGVGTILINPSEGSLRLYLESLNHLLELNLTALLPAHGPIITDANETLKNYIDHRHMRTQQVLDALRKGFTTPIEIAREVYQELPDQFHRIASIQVNSHLIWLSEEGTVEYQEDQWYVL